MNTWQTFLLVYAGFGLLWVIYLLRTYQRKWRWDPEKDTKQTRPGPMLFIAFYFLNLVLWPACSVIGAWAYAETTKPPR